MSWTIEKSRKWQDSTVKEEVNIAPLAWSERMDDKIILARLKYDQNIKTSENGKRLEKRPDERHKPNTVKKHEGTQRN